MSLVDLYVTEVGRHLPAKNREDIEKEIRSMIEDMLDDAGREQGRQPDEEMVVQVLKKLGSPDKVAASYAPPRYLIGPRYFPTFLLVMRIVLTVLLIIAAVGLGVNIGRSTGGTDALISLIVESITGFFTSAMAALGNVVLVFAIMQWLMPEPKFDTKEWDPRQLKDVDSPDTVKPVESAVAVVLNLALLLVLTLYPQWIGISTIVDGQWRHAPILATAFFQYLPVMAVLLIGGVVLNAILLRTGQWNTALRWFSIALHLGTIILTAVMLNGPDLVSIESANLVSRGWETSAANTLAELELMFNIMFRMALGITIVMQVIETGKELLRIFRPNMSLPAVLKG